MLRVPSLVRQPHTCRPVRLFCAVNGAWTEIERTTLKRVMASQPGDMSTRARWDAIAGELPGRTAQACILQHKKMKPPTSTQDTQSEPVVAPAGAKVTDEGIIVHEANPDTRNGLGLVWGNKMWASGRCLAKYFAWRGSTQLRAKKVLELGAGTGLVGLTMGQLGAQVTVTDHEMELWGLMRYTACRISLHV